MQNVFQLDNRYFNVRIPEGGITRSFSIADTDKAGRVLSGSMVRDIIGTYYNYSIQIDTNLLSKAEYDALYELLSSPQDYHTLTVPYGQTTITFKAYITEGQDTLVRQDKNGNKWKGLTINFIAVDPYRK